MCNFKKRCARHLLPFIVCSRHEHSGPFPQKLKLGAPVIMRSDETLPSRENAAAALAPALHERHARVREAMLRLRRDPPQVLLLEGGLEHERFSMALWYAALLNCELAPPCLSCPTCLQIGADLFADLHIIDGRNASIKIESIRELRALLGEAPRGGGKRVVVLAEAQALIPQAANALLKSLEEPNPGTVFALLAPQRGRLLPTLVSRGWTLTLAWPDVAAPLPEDMRAWADALGRFLLHGQGWFDLTGVKGAVDAKAARQAVLVFQKALAAVSAGRNAGELGPALEPLPPTARFAMRDALANAQESLDFMINPALVLDSLVTRLFLITHSRRQV
jgi:DNA polymerase-3 subunit delta'